MTLKVIVLLQRISSAVVGYGKSASGEIVLTSWICAFTSSCR